MDFRIRPLARQRFAHLFGLSDAELTRHRARRVVADSSPGYPCRVSLRDAEIGESLLLVNFCHQPADGPYRASHAVFVIEGAAEHTPAPNEIPAVLVSRQLSLRAFSERGELLAAELVAGEHLETSIRRALGDKRNITLHLHNAAPGCYAARVERA